MNKPIQGCWNCPFCKSEKVYTADSFENVEKLTCGATDKVIASYHETFDKDPIPDWCPLREVKSVKLVDVPKKPRARKKP